MVVGCGSNPSATNPPPPANKPVFLYTANVQTADVWGFQVNTTTGMLTPVPGSPYSVLNPISVVVETSARFAYVADFTNNNIYEFTINQANGASHGDRGFPNSGRQAIRLRWFWMGQASSCTRQTRATIVSPALRLTRRMGTLAPLPGSPFPAQLGTDSVAIDPVKNRLYAANGSSDTISVFDIDTGTGALSEIAGSPFTIGSIVGDYARTIAVSPKGTFLYVADATSWGPESTSVFGFVIDANGALTPAPGSPFVAGTDPITLTFDAAGKFLYVANSKDSSISGFAIQPDGSLTPTPSSPYTTQPWPMCFGVDPSGKSLYVGHDSTALLVFTIDATTGALTSEAGPMSGGGSPWSIAFAQIR